MPWLGSITAQPGFVYRAGEDPRALCCRCIVERIYAVKGVEPITWEELTEPDRRCDRCAQLMAQC